MIPLNNKSALWKYFTVPIIIILILAACGGDDMEADNMDMDDTPMDEVIRLPNNGAVVRIVSPTDGEVFSEGVDIVVEIETENFELGLEGGNHWHVFVDGITMGMVIGGDYDYALRGIEPGEHQISVFLSPETHKELEDGAMVQIVIEASD